MKKRAVIALGSNVGDTLANLKEAVKRLEEKGCGIEAVSPLYQTEPWGFAEQEDFLNGAIIITTESGPEELLVLTQSVEKEMGRKKEFLNGPRNIDLDILLYEDKTVDRPELVIPHPRIGQRLFVLKPLNDIASDWLVPGCGRVAALYEAYDGTERVDLTEARLR